MEGGRDSLLWDLGVSVGSHHLLPREVGGVWEGCGMVGSPGRFRTWLHRLWLISLSYCQYHSHYPLHIPLQQVCIPYHSVTSPYSIPLTSTGVLMQYHSVSSEELEGTLSVESPSHGRAGPPLHPRHLHLGWKREREGGGGGEMERERVESHTNYLYEVNENDSVSKAPAEVANEGCPWFPSEIIVDPSSVVLQLLFLWVGVHGDRQKRVYVWQPTASIGGNQSSITFSFEAVQTLVVITSLTSPTELAHASFYQYTTQVYVQCLM